MCHSTVVKGLFLSPWQRKHFYVYGLIKCVGVLDTLDEEKEFMQVHFPTTDSHFSERDFRWKRWRLIKPSYHTDRSEIKAYDSNLYDLILYLLVWLSTMCSKSTHVLQQTCSTWPDYKVHHRDTSYVSCWQLSSHTVSHPDVCNVVV